ncbi:MAG: hypothetical protein IT562_04680 [Alphaproteobacteria bacterium]|nr:hypothetical protein [Alphaproteobacteria bacterium]
MCIQIPAMEKGVHGNWRVDALPGTADAGTGCTPETPAKRRRSTSEYKVITDLPPMLPVTEAELELLESELAEFIAELMKK